MRRETPSSSASWVWVKPAALRSLARRAPKPSIPACVLGHKPTPDWVRLENIYPVSCMTLVRRWDGSLCTKIVQTADLAGCLACCTTRGAFGNRRGKQNASPSKGAHKRRGSRPAPRHLSNADGQGRPRIRFECDFLKAITPFLARYLQARERRTPSRYRP